MKWKKRFVSGLALLFVISLLLTGCSSGNKSAGKGESSSQSSGDRSKWPKQITVGSGPLGGTFNVVCTGWSKLLMDELKVQATAEVTGSTVDNVKLVNKGETDFGLSTVGGAYEGYTGTGWAQGQKYENIRATIPMFPSYLHWWSMAKDNIKSIYDLEGKAVNFAPRGSNADVMGRRVLEFFGVKPARFVNTNFEDANDLMKDGSLHASVCTAGLPLPAINSLAVTDAVSVFGIEEADGKKFVEKYPFLVLEQIPANTYKGQDKPIWAFTDWNTMLVNKDTPADLVYEVVKISMENPDKMKAIHNSLKDATINNAAKITIPMHVGAIKYFEEKGIKLPASAYPPEYKK